MSSTIELLEEVLAELRAIRASLGSQSSVQVATSTRGHDLTVKAYAGSSVREAGDAAIDEYVRGSAELTRKLMGGT